MDFDPLLRSPVDQHPHQWINDFYASVVEAGISCAKSKVAEAAKVTENTQRDLNIALINELSMTLNALELILVMYDAASTKWNFLPFVLVWWADTVLELIHITLRIAEQSGYYPQVVLAGRRINDGLADYY